MLRSSILDTSKPDNCSKLTIITINYYKSIVDLCGCQVSRGAFKLNERFNQSCNVQICHENARLVTRSLLGPESTITQITHWMKRFFHFYAQSRVRTRVRKCSKFDQSKTYEISGAECWLEDHNPFMNWRKSSVSQPDYFGNAAFNGTRKLG